MKKKRQKTRPDDLTKIHKLTLKTKKNKEQKQEIQKKKRKPNPDKSTENPN